MSRILINEAWCKGCNLCAEACPKGVLKLSRRTNALGLKIMEAAQPELCIGCAACADVCPDIAITVWRSHAEKNKDAKPGVLRG